MEQPDHTLASLFEQLGLDSSDHAIQEFIEQHSPLPGSVELHEADFWSPAQASFLREAKEQDADWVEVVDQLDALLR